MQVTLYTSGLRVIAGFQFGKSLFGVRGLLPGPFATRCCKRRPHGRVYAVCWKETPCFGLAPRQ